MCTKPVQQQPFCKHVMEQQAGSRGAPPTDDAPLMRSVPKAGIPPGHGVPQLRGCLTAHTGLRKAKRNTLLT